MYIPLQNGLHCKWGIYALDSGKHVLYEKPIAANAVEAKQMATAAEQFNRLMIEAFHWRYHKLADRMHEIVQIGIIGMIKRIEVHLCFPLLMPNDIRYRYELAGGTMMDVGCYAVNIIRFLIGANLLLNMPWQN